MDEFGFQKTYDEFHENIYRTEVLPVLQERDEKWFEYIKNVGGTFNVLLSDSKFKSMVRLGIPSEVRLSIWGKITGLFDKMEKSQNLFSQSCEAFGKLSADIVNAINLDIPRTFPASKLNSESLRKILMAVAVVHPEIGYCQSMNFIAAVSLTVFNDEEQAFLFMLIIIEDYLPREYYTPTMKDYQVDLTMFAILLKERTPDTYEKAKSVNYLWIQSTSNWLLSIFSNTLPMSTVLRIWDSFLLEGQKIVFRVGLAIVKMHHDQLESARATDFANVMRKIQNNLVDQNKLMEIAFGLKAFSRAHVTELRQKASDIVKEHGPQADSDCASGFHSFLGHMNL